MPEVMIDAPREPVQAHLAHSDSGEQRPGVVHDALGMTTDLHHQADWLAENGFLALAPDLLPTQTEASVPLHQHVRVCRIGAASAAETLAVRDVVQVPDRGPYQRRSDERHVQSSPGRVRAPRGVLSVSNTRRCPSRRTHVVTSAPRLRFGQRPHRPASRRPGPPDPCSSVGSRAPARMR